MLERVSSFYDWFDVEDEERERVRPIVEKSAQDANGMIAVEDYHALAAIALHFRPERIFEVGTYLGVTSDFFLQVLPASGVVSIAYVPDRDSPDYNNTELLREQVGTMVSADRRARFRQLIGDSHELSAGEVRGEFGPFDLVFVDGDHSREGVDLDTALARQIIAPDGVICWHDANPKPKYLAVREFLEQDLELPAVATMDEYVGGVACWSREIAHRLEHGAQGVPAPAPRT